MRNHQNPWRWLLSIGVASAVLWVLFFIVPPQWFAFLLNIHENPLGDHANLHETWLVLQLPPEILIEAEPEPKTPSKLLLPELELFHPDDWWNTSVGISVVARPVPEFPQVSHQDSVAYFLNSLGLASDFMTHSRPDSILASKIFFLKMEDSFDFTEAKPYLSALGRARDYADIMSRAAAMYDEFLNTTIMVPD